MVQFTFDGLFRTTYKGLPDDTANVDPYSYLTMNHFVYSLIVQIFIGLTLTGFTGISMYRAFCKIKNEKFFLEQAQQQQAQKQEDQKSKSQNQPQQNTNDNLIYRFDEQDNENQKNWDKQKEQQDDEQNQQNQIQEQTASEQTTEWLLDLDHKLLFFSPFLISFVVAINIFASNIFVVLLMIASMLCYYMFNFKLYCSKVQFLQTLFMLPCIFAFLTVFVQDKNMST